MGILSLEIRPWIPKENRLRIPGKQAEIRIHHTPVLFMHGKHAVLH